MARPKTVDPMDPAFWATGAEGAGAGTLDPTEVDLSGGVDPGATGTDVHGGPAGPPIPYNPIVTINSGPQTAPPEPPPPPPVTTPTTPEPPLPTVPAGPIPADDTLPPLAVPPPLTATGLPTFSVGGGVGRGLRTPSFRSNRVVGGGAEDALLGGITKRFDSGIPVAQTPLPSGLSGDNSDSSTYTDEDLLKKSILGRR